MNMRIQRLVPALAAFATLAPGGVAYAQATHRAGHHAHHVAVRAVSTTPASPADADNVQSGDQNAPDAVGATEQAAGDTPETAGAESPAAADGPSGRADEAGAGANAGHQFEGTE